MNTKLLGIGVVVAIVLGLVGALKTIPQTTQEFGGAVAGSDFPGPSLSVNGVYTYYARTGMNTATNTPCSIKSPNATSTLVGASVFFRTSSTTLASVVDIANAATALTGTTATTTRLADKTTIAAGDVATIIASSTSPLVTTFAPNSFLVVRMDNGAGVFSPTGTCQAVFRVI